MKDMAVLYIAEHNVTGLKYFGKTTRYFTVEELQEKYHGSGTYWKRHLKKHGDDVTMTIYRLCSLNEDSDDYIKPIALKFSQENNIVESNDWANNIPENGLDGGREAGFVLAKNTQSDTVCIVSKQDFQNDDELVGVRRGCSLTLEQRENISKSQSGEKHHFYGKTFSDEHKRKIGETKVGNQYRLNKKHTEEAKRKMSEAHIGMRYSDETNAKKTHIGSENGMYGKRHTDETKQKISEKLKGKKAWNANLSITVTCPHCNKTGIDSAGMRRWHFNNCIKRLTGGNDGQNNN